MPKVGVVLSGCGVYDGAEIHESVAALLALDRAGAEVVFFAPNAKQMHVFDHQKGAPAKGESRNVMVESARIARGAVRDAAAARAADIDALIFPGGFGGAKNLSDFAVAGRECTVNPEVKRLVLEMHAAGKPVGFICIMPAVAARIYQLGGVKGVKLTIGKDTGTAATVKAMGAEHVERDVRDIAVDEKHKVVSTPAYMLAQRIGEVFDGIEKLVVKVMEMAR